MAAPEISGAETTKNKVVYAGETLIDLTEDTVTPATLKSGVTAHDASGAKITGTLDTTPPEESDINFWDYDGTLLYAWTLAELATKTELPPLPSHEGLICQGWNWTLQDIKDADRELDIGALYITDDGKTRLYVDVDAETWDDFVLWYWQSSPRATTVDWGDGTTPEAINADGYVEHRHVYASSGKYTITMSVADGRTMWLGAGTFKLISSNLADSGRCSMLEKVEIGARCTQISGGCLAGCVRLKSISCPTSTAATYPTRTFEGCTQLRVINLAGIGEMNQTFYRCANLRAVSTPKGATTKTGYTIGETAVRQINFDTPGVPSSLALERVHILANNGAINGFSYCTSLLEATTPADGTSLANMAFTGDTALRRVTCLGSIASIGTQTFQTCYALRFVDLTNCTAVPTLASADAFAQTHAQLEIRVPAALYDEWKAATNWASLADHIVPVGVAQNGSVLSIFSGVTVTQTGEELQIGG